MNFLHESSTINLRQEVGDNWDVLSIDSSEPISGVEEDIFHQSPVVSAEKDQDGADASNDDCDDTMSINNLNKNGTKKRKYHYMKRKEKVSSSVSRQQKWTQALQSMTEAKLRRTSCCKQLKCFKEVNYSFFKQRSKELLSSATVSRRASLQAMRGSDGDYFFNGRRVCTRFLKKSFHFSSDLLANEGGDFHDKSNTSQISNICATSNHDGTYTSSSSTLQFRFSPQKDSIVSFLLRLSEDCSEKMPDKIEYHLPFFQKREVYSHFINEYKKLYKSQPPSPHYFLTVWKTACGQIKVRKSSRFTVCDTCEQIRAAMKDAVLKGGDTRELKARKREHLKMVSDERMEYQKKRDRTRLEPSVYCSVIVDGADQSAYGLPHFTTKTKDTSKGRGLKVHLIGALEHNVDNILHLFTMTEEHETGSNHIVETVHRFLNDRRDRGKLPPNLFVQVDNCTRENKNQYLMAYMEHLVAASVFQSVEVGFLPVGHTHEDIDQCFSQTSRELDNNNALTLPELHKVVSVVNHGHTKVSHMRRIANWKDLCEQERCIRRVNNISQYRYFKFSRSFSEHDTLQGAIVSTRCHVKHSCYDQWREMFPSKKGKTPSGILKHCPDLNKTPSLKITCPVGYNDVTKRIQAEEGRINNIDKMIHLTELRDFVFKSRVDEFHWDLSEAAETEHINKHRSSSGNGEDVDEIQPQVQAERNSNRTSITQPIDVSSNPPNANVASKVRGVLDVKNKVDIACSSKHVSGALSRVSYVVGSFVAVQTDEDSASPGSQTFWIGKVLDTVNQCGESYVKRLKVHWYDMARKEEPLQGQYHPCYNSSKSKVSCSGTRKVARRKLQVPFVDMVDTDTVIVSFQNLTKRNTLPLSVQKKLST